VVQLPITRPEAGRMQVAAVLPHPEQNELGKSSRSLILFSSWIGDPSVCPVQRLAMSSVGEQSASCLLEFSHYQMMFRLSNLVCHHYPKCP